MSEHICPLCGSEVEVSQSNIAIYLACTNNTFNCGFHARARRRHYDRLKTVIFGEDPPKEELANRDEHPCEDYRGSRPPILADLTEKEE